MYKQPVVHTLDLKFLGLHGTIAAYLIQHSNGAILVESGPGSTIPALQAALNEHGLSPQDISDVLLTHIHLDHAGAAGWLATQGARIHVHPVGAPHMRNPEKLIASATRIYGDQMERLWGAFLPVPSEQLNVLHDGEELDLNGMHFLAIETPGHADHHLIYQFEDLCFCGDIGGVRMFSQPHLRLPMPPPELHLEKWFTSLERLKQLPIRRIAPTHFGIFEDASWHIKALDTLLNKTADWISEIMPGNPAVEEINRRLVEWTSQRAVDEGIDGTCQAKYEAANPSWMSGYGIQRYWQKFHSGES